MDRQEIIDKVKLRIDEFGPFEEGEVFGSAQVESLLDDAVNQFLLIIPAFLPTPTSFADESSSTGGAVPIDDYIGYVPLPTGYLRLVSFQMDCWKRAVTEAISENDPKYAIQQSTHVRGGVSRPAVVYRYESGIGKILEYYSVSDNNHDVKKALCLVTIVAEDLDEFLVDPFTWFAAYLLLDSRGETTGAQACLKKTTDWITFKTAGL